MRSSRVLPVHKLNAHVSLYVWTPLTRRAWGLVMGKVDKIPSRLWFWHRRIDRIRSSSHPESSGVIRSHPGSPGDIQRHPKPSGVIRGYLQTFSVIWSHLESSGVRVIRSRSHPESKSSGVGVVRSIPTLAKSGQLRSTPIPANSNSRRLRGLRLLTTLTPFPTPTLTDISFY